MRRPYPAVVRQTNVKRPPLKCPEILDTRWQTGQGGFRTGKRTLRPLAHVGYARVSTLVQNSALQIDALAAAGCAKVFEDRASGAKADRAGLKRGDLVVEVDGKLDPSAADVQQAAADGQLVVRVQRHGQAFYAALHK